SSSLLPSPPSSTLFPYTTLFRSVAEEALHVGIGARRVVGTLVVQLTLEDELYGLGVEWRAVVERHVRAELERVGEAVPRDVPRLDRKSTRLNSSHVKISYAVFCL